MNKWVKCDNCKNAVVMNVCEVDNYVYDVHFNYNEGYLALYKHKKGDNPITYHMFPVQFFALYETYYRTEKPITLHIEEYYDSAKNKMWLNDCWVDLDNVADIIMQRYLKKFSDEMSYDKYNHSVLGNFNKYISNVVFDEMIKVVYSIIRQSVYRMLNNYVEHERTKWERKCRSGLTAVIMR